MRATTESRSVVAVLGLRPCLPSSENPYSSRGAMMARLVLLAVLGSALVPSLGLAQEGKRQEQLRTETRWVVEVIGDRGVDQVLGQFRAWTMPRTVRRSGPNRHPNDLPRLTRGRARSRWRIRPPDPPSAKPRRQGPRIVVRPEAVASRKKIAVRVTSGSATSGSSRPTVPTNRHRHRRGPRLLSPHLGGHPDGPRRGMLRPAKPKSREGVTLLGTTWQPAYGNGEVYTFLAGIYPRASRGGVSKDVSPRTGVGRAMASRSR